MQDQQRELRGSLRSSARQPAASPLGATLDFWRKAFTYSGRATRAEYNWPLLIFLLASVPASALFAFVIPRPVSTILGGAFWSVFIVPWLALVARRCHDLNRRGVFGLWLLATGIGFLITEGILMFGDSDPQGSRFDEDTVGAH